MCLEDFELHGAGPGLFEPAAQLPTSRDAAALQEECPPAENCKIGDRPDLIADGQIRMRVYIHLKHQGATGHIFRQGLDFRPG